MIIRAMRSSDLHAVVELHQKAFPGFFLTRMGPKFIHCYYQAVLDFNASISLVATHQDSKKLYGFVVGFSDQKGFYELFAQRRNQMILAILRALLRDPWLVPLIIQNKRRVEAQAKLNVSAGELSSIAVDKQGNGIGGKLLKAFMDEALSAGLTEIELTTDAQENSKVKMFYEKSGFSLEKIEKRAGRELCRYSRRLG